MPSKWNDILIAKFRLHLAAGFSLQICGDLINKEFGTDFSRNAMIGKANRLGYKSSPSTILNNKREKNLERPKFRGSLVQAKVRPKPRTQPPKPAPAPLRCIAVEPLNLTLLEAATHDVCRWPCGGWPAATPVRFCGHPKADDSSYCLNHTQLSFRNVA